MKNKEKIFKIGYDESQELAAYLCEMKEDQESEIRCHFQLP